jgi:hypothetical protein
MIPYSHLLDRPWSEHNCSSVVRTALNGWFERGGDTRRVTELDLPSCRLSGHRALRQYSTGGSEVWVYVSEDATKAETGDVILSYGDRGPHVSLALGGGVALTSTQRRGVYAIGLRFITDVQGVFRLR